MMDAKYEEGLDRAKRAKELAEGFNAPVITAEQEKNSQVDELLSLAGKYGIANSIALLRGVLRDRDAERGVFNGNPKMYTATYDADLNHNLAKSTHDYSNVIPVGNYDQRLLEESMFAHTGQPVGNDDQRLLEESMFAHTGKF